MGEGGILPGYIHGFEEIFKQPVTQSPFLQVWFHVNGQTQLIGKWCDSFTRAS
jgi:hypothetical protein